MAPIHLPDLNSSEYQKFPMSITEDRKSNQKTTSEERQDRQQSYAPTRDTIYKTPHATMAGTSGCIPDYHVNLFSKLCKPAPNPSIMTAIKPGPQADTNDHINEAPVPSSTSVRAPEPDPIHQLFNENQNLIRGLSLGNVETYLAAVKEVFAGVRRDRANAYVELPRKQRGADHRQVELIDQKKLSTRVNMGPNSRTNTTINNEINSRQNRELTRRINTKINTVQHPKQHQPHQEEHQPQHQLQHQPQIPPKHPAHPFIITHYSKDNDEDKKPRQSRLQREEDAMYYIEDDTQDRETDCDEFRGLDALLMPNFTGDPRKKYGFDQMRLGE
ncbi:hypothetical protein HO173_009596 [Letharia columbiana]|uniref:Uncharacterized protein n=1 Tax=Letharia columbiana TaxID=112416 RepID=A0A8H6FPB5_9LECA|nr:uncharacterized protein HO173_009596 [Letharia columbiana]KAF6232213.1 hypothetical protein HO173_009596 [Letharia columbiana]